MSETNLKLLSGVVGVVGVLALVFALVFGTALAEEPLPQNIAETQNRIQRRIKSIEKIDGQMKPLKDEIAHLQETRDPLDTDLREDAKRLQRWGYQYDWATGDVTQVDPKVEPSK